MIGASDVPAHIPLAPVSASSVEGVPAVSAWARVRTSIFHRILTPGWRRPTPAARVRGWARLLQWRSAKTMRARLALLGRVAVHPLRAWHHATLGVRAFGAEVAEVSGVSPRAQRLQLWWLTLAHGLTATGYIDYGLYRADRRRRAAAYLEQREHARVVWWLLNRTTSPAGLPARNKAAFAPWCRAHGLPFVPTLVELESGRIAASYVGDDVAAGLPQRDLFAKPSDSQYGSGAMRFRHAAPGQWLSDEERLLDATQLMAALAGVSRRLESHPGRAPNRLLVQPRLVNHRDLLPLTPGALSTVRILVSRAPAGKPFIVFAAYRMAVGSSPADNFHFGGIIAPVDTETGRLGPALRRRTHVLVPIEKHPDTGAVIAGHQLPLWAETRALALRAFEAARERVCVGWDVAITDDGPVLIEANTASHPDIAQITADRPLSDTPYPAALDAHMRSALGLQVP